MRAALASAYPGPLPSKFFLLYPSGGGCTRPALDLKAGRQGASLQHAYFPPKYPYLLDIIGPTDWGYRGWESSIGVVQQVSSFPSPENNFKSFFKGPEDMLV